MNLKIENTIRILYHGWKEAGLISNREDVKKSRLSIYMDMFRCYVKYQIRMPQYSENNIFNLSGVIKDKIGEELKKQNSQNEYWEDIYNKNWIFLRKYSKLKWEKTSRTRARRANAYVKHFGLGKNCYVQYGVMFICEHFNVGKLTVGENVLFARDCDIDYTGDLTIGKDCLLSESVKIITHNHDYLDDHALIPTPLSIGEDVVFGVRAIVMPGTRKIGRGAMISAGAVVKYEVPPYSIVTGNPAKIVGFRFTPEQIMEYEEEHYPENERLTEEELRSNYKKYFLDRITDISNYLK